MKTTFLGVGNAYSQKNANSVLLIENDDIKLCIDCGRSTFPSVEEYGLSLKDITHILITHLHNESVGGLEEAAFMTKFVFKFKIKLLATPSMLEHLWNCTLKGGLEYIEELPGDLRPHILADYFDVIELQPDQWNEISPELRLFLHPTDHVKGMESYGVEVETNGKKRFLFSGDTKFSSQWLTNGAAHWSHVFHDCQLADEGENNVLGHHASYNQLLKLQPDIRQKMWLYHYGDEALPDCKKDGFAGFVQHLQSFVF